MNSLAHCTRLAAALLAVSFLQETVASQVAAKIQLLGNRRNPIALDAARPVVGTRWNAMVDTKAFDETPSPGAGVLLILDTRPALDPPLLLPNGRDLFIEGPHIDVLLAPTNQERVARFSFDFPADPTLFGLVVSAQGVLASAAADGLTNGINLRIGGAGEGSCGSEDARLNQPSSSFLPTSYKSEAYDVVPLSNWPGDSFWVAYSARTHLNCTGSLSNNTTMSVFRLHETEEADVLLFGTGYGCRMAGACPGEFPAGALPDGVAIDAAKLDEIIRGCMGVNADAPQRRPVIDVIVPHGHRDHINPELIHALEDLGHEIHRIFVHTADYKATQAIGTNVIDSSCEPAYDPNWTAADLARLVQIGNNETECEASPDEARNAGYPTFRTQDSGTVWIRRRSGHTDGSIDLILDHLDDPRDRWMVLGSVQSHSCSELPMSAFRGVVHPHGNVYLNPWPF